MSLLTKLLKLRFKPQAGQLYGAAVAHARNPVFYTHFGVDDTPDGRLALISLHVLLILERLSGPGGGIAAAVHERQIDTSGTAASGCAKDETRDRELGQALMESFVEDLDVAMRELGIGDMGVPKRVKKAMAQFYDFARRYRALVSNGQTDNVSALLRDMIPGRRPEGTGQHPLSDYVHEVAVALSDHSTDTLVAGQLALPDPARQ